MRAQGICEYNEAKANLPLEGQVAMGIKFGREYNDIINDFTDALRGVEGCCEFLEMPADDWDAMSEEEQKECMKTLADDLFYGLGVEAQMSIGDCMVTHDPKRHLIRIDQGETLTTVIYLV
ncbi:MULTISPECIES: hypothetical protein [Paenibacillus]|uniref:hypothetical protein n=1 Tax=Paenibacillus TaxID=44249 RepID=UPI0020C89DA2|nr:MULTISPECIES: hypothetical protein [Paenibacillus]